MTSTTEPRKFSGDARPVPPDSAMPAQRACRPSALARLTARLCLVWQAESSVAATVATRSSPWPCSSGSPPSYPPPSPSSRPSPSQSPPSCPSPRWPLSDPRLPRGGRPVLSRSSSRSSLSPATPPAAERRDRARARVRVRAGRGEGQRVVCACLMCPAARTRPHGARCCVRIARSPVARSPSLGPPSFSTPVARTPVASRVRVAARPRLGSRVQAGSWVMYQADMVPDKRLIRLIRHISVIYETDMVY